MDVKQFAGKIRSLSRQSASNIDLQEPTSEFRKTFDEPDLENAPIDFGSFSMNGQSPPHSFGYEYFIISTPRSSDEWQISPGPPDELKGPVSVTEGDELIARLEDITLPESVEAPLPFEEASAEEVPRETREIEIRQELDCYFADYPALPEPAEREVTGREPEVEMPDIKPRIAAEAELPVVEEQRIPDLMPPDISVRAPGPAPDRPAPDVRSPRSSPRPDRRRRTVDDEQSFILGPVSVTDRGSRVRCRRRCLIVDQVTKLSLEQMIRNCRSTYSRPSILDRIKRFDDKCKESVASILSRFGSFPKRFWRNRRTLPEPDDLAPFHVIPEEEPIPPDMPEEEIGVPDIPRTVDDKQSFILGPVSVTYRGGRVRRRRRRLNVDQVTKLSREQMIRNCRSTYSRFSLLDRRIELDDKCKESVASILSRFGSFPKRFWRNRRTLPEPDDLSPFHIIPEEEPI